jgi:hypothetical protein
VCAARGSGASLDEAARDRAYLDRIREDREEAAARARRPAVHTGIVRMAETGDDERGYRPYLENNSGRTAYGTLNGVDADDMFRRFDGRRVRVTIEVVDN